MEINKIYNEDCLEGMKRITDNSIDLVVTDPPYTMTKRGKSCRPNWMGSKEECFKFGRKWIEVEVIE